jgi:G:T-mismatch repair DNA endonuclease (very short patch repair protein)
MKKMWILNCDKNKFKPKKLIALIYSIRIWCSNFSKLANPVGPACTMIQSIKWEVAIVWECTKIEVLRLNAWR